MEKNILYYSNNAEALAEQYDNVPFESVHKDWLEEIPEQGMVLDVGAGSGRDARYLSEQGLQVYAVEPAKALIALAKEKSLKCNITWYQDRLPDLEKIKKLDIKFDLILLSAVWMHLSSDERAISLQNMASLLSPGGKLVITLRHGEFSDGRTAFQLSTEEVCHLAADNGLSVLLTTDLIRDQLGRGNVVWQTVVLGK
ncbi:class I SAM-dependent methyltransferase [Thalassotalea litorea]|uniref:Class I SAM-dependent methyltransferase n=1 Tax=Thalassotalea litorea TaxID=2020715 RepID=A0A5R9IID0_9GAMM|nr:class I SAM-dependent methyltransferase [Thalassotalea litorea]TLU65294.1 class I SAM-dependent methyltransferase [Thalassotalea litorea]